LTEPPRHELAMVAKHRQIPNETHINTDLCFRPLNPVPENRQRRYDKPPTIRRICTSIAYFPERNSCKKLNRKKMKASVQLKASFRVVFRAAAPNCESLKAFASMAAASAGSDTPALDATDVRCPLSVAEWRIAATGMTDLRGVAVAL